MISRQWRGLARVEMADHYIKHLQRETFPALRQIPGFLGASILRRELKAGTEFLIVTRWQSLHAIQKFAGTDPEIAVVPDSVKGMMLEYDTSVRHYTVVE